MAIINIKNENLMRLIKRVHSVVENPDIEKQRQSQDNLGALLGNNKEISIKEAELEGMYAEWLSVNRAHMEKQVILYCHGGGYMTGSCMYARTLTTKLATSTSMDVLAFDYRLAPEHPYPAALQDALVAWDYLMHLGYGAENVVVAGDSAGGNLALSLVHKLKEDNRLLPGGLVLMSPWTDMTATAKTYTTKAELDPVLDIGYIRLAIQSYAGEEDAENPFISPLFGNFEDFPPTYIQVGENEILLHDSTELYKNMLHDGVSVKLDKFTGMWHVFQMSPFKTAYDAMDRNAQFIFNLYR